MNSKYHDTNMKSAAIVCSHIVKNNMPVRVAIKDETVTDEDSGWQFLCGQDIEENEPMILALCEILNYDPSISLFLHMKNPVMLCKLSENSEWTVVNTDEHRPR